MLPLFSPTIRGMIFLMSIIDKQTTNGKRQTANDVRQTGRNVMLKKEKNLRQYNIISAVKSFVILVVACFALSCSTSVNKTGNLDRDIYFITGSYSESSEEGVKLYKIDSDSVIISEITGVKAGTNPSFITFSPDGGLLYAVNETTSDDGRREAGVTTIKFDRREMSLVNVGYCEISGTGPCHVSSDDKGEYLFLSNYGNGSLSVLGNRSDGLPDVETLYFKYNDDSGMVSHVHMALQIPGTARLLVSDLGFDRLSEYRMVYNGNNLNLIPERIIDLPDGSGPRHFAPEEEGKYLYVVNELSSEVVVFKRTITGDFINIQTIKTLPADYAGVNYCADIKISNCGNYLYVSNRGHNSIASFTITDSGMVELINHVSCEGDWPRNFTVDSNNKLMLVANQRSDNIALFFIDKESGLPVYSGKSINITSPSCVIFIADNSSDKN